MERGKYTALFVAIIIGLAIGFVIGAQSFDATKPTHSIQQTTTDETGTTSVDADANAQIDVSDTVTDIGGNINIVPGGGLHANAVVMKAFPYNTWVLAAQGALPAIPATADYLIVEYEMNTGTTCTGPVNLEFTNNPANPAMVHVQMYDAGAVSAMHAQVIVPASNIAPGKTHVKYTDGNGGVGNCGANVYITGWFD